MTTSVAAAWETSPVVDSPFDQYQRYRIVAELVTAASGEAGRALRVLDVGGHHTDFYGGARRPIAEVLPSHATVTVDLAENPHAGYVRAIGDRLPFLAHAFDAVASVDVLEHVPPAARPGVLDEVLRVARSAAIIAAPFDDWRVVRAEQIFSSFIEAVLGEPQRQLAEHRANGLPSLAATVAHLRRAGWAVSVLPYGNVWRWLFMMLDKHAIGLLPGARPVHQQLDATYNRELFEQDRELPCYRHFIIATRDAGDPLQAFAAERFGARPFEALEPVPTSDAAADRILTLAEQHARMQRVALAGEPLRRETQLAELATHARNLELGLEAKDAYIAELEQILRDVEQSLTFRVSRTVRRIIPGS